MDELHDKTTMKFRIGEQSMIGDEEHPECLHPHSRQHAGMLALTESHAVVKQ